MPWLCYLSDSTRRVVPCEGKRKQPTEETESLRDHVVGAIREFIHLDGFSELGGHLVDPFGLVVVTHDMDGLLQPKWRSRVAVGCRSATRCDRSAQSDNGLAGIGHPSCVVDRVSPHPAWPAFVRADAWINVAKHPPSVFRGGHSACWALQTLTVNCWSVVHCPGCGRDDVFCCSMSCLH